MPPKALGRDLRLERIKRGVNQTDMAMALGLARPELSRLENEWLPINDEFIDRYRETLDKLAAEKAS